MTRLLSVIVGSLFFTLHSFAANNDWPQWRGPNRDGISKETGLLKEWPATGPKRVWLFENAGAGYSSFAIANGKLFTMGTRDNNATLIALDANSGKELWAAPMGSIFNEKRGGGPRGTPAVDGARVYGMSGNGNLVCVNIADGTIAWQKQMKDLGGVLQKWGYSESVLIDGNNVLCTPGGAQGTVAALNKTSGALVWQTKDFTDEAQYSSIVPATINAVPQYVQITIQNIVGIAPKNGKVLWKADWPGRTAVIPTPIIHDNLVYVTSGYGVGCKLIRIGANNQVETVYENKVMKNHHGGVILIGDHIYGHADAGWTCQNFKTGEEVWNHRAFDKGAVAFADGML